MASYIEAVQVIDDTGTVGLLVNPRGLALTQRDSGWGEAAMVKAGVHVGEQRGRGEEGGGIPAGADSCVGTRNPIPRRSHRQSTDW